MFRNAIWLGMRARGLPVMAGWVLSAGVLLAVLPVHAAGVMMPRVFGDHMVLQRERPVPAWGWTDPGAQVSVEFAGQRKEANAGPDGRWEIRLDAMPACASGAVFRVVQGTNTLEFKDVVVGEVWLCSGQSNMQGALSNAAGASEDIATAAFPNLRYFDIAPYVDHNLCAATPQRDFVKARPWTSCTHYSSAMCYAVGFYFGRRLHAELGVPVGLIQAACAGAPIEPFIPLEGYDTVPELADVIGRFREEVQGYREAIPEVTNELETWIRDARQAIAAETDLPPEPAWPVHPGAKNNRQPAAIYHVMVCPVIPYAVRGAIWYQGESNTPDKGDLYYHKMRALIGGWRRVWGQGEFPFYYVQLPNYSADQKKPGGDTTGWANLRDCQFKALAITNTGMTVAIDVGEKDIHPRNKFDTGERLARWALARDYGRTDLVISGPLYRAMEIEDTRIRLFFDHVGGGLMTGEKTGRAPVRETPGGKLQRFAVSGEDRQWVWADARIDGDAVLVASPAVPHPVAARYAFSINPTGCNLYNRDGIPASPFRTDAW